MDKPPFPAASIARVFPEQPGLASPAQLAEAGRSRRVRLEDLNQHFHCSVIGTCMSTAAMRKLMRRVDPSTGPQDTDLDIHHAAVSAAMSGGVGAKTLTKALDGQHAATIRRFAPASSAE